ncbi:hypothetical protein F5Y15DRAFT_51248 [Xylariaceae sp. FL0016]|nr:hypothetical protein F5Y15DRAFT_51248 [Xylariaceae sp. FL0016]
MDRSHLIPEARGRPRASSKGDTTASQELGRAGNSDHHAISTTMNPIMEPRHSPHKLVLCFDGTGNKFRGDDSDSNILKIFRCLDREAGDQYHYYQPGIGTYIVSNSLSHTSLGARIRSWYLKAKDSAIGSSFDQHVVGGYRFLMRFYNPGDEIYFFGFSRGAYVARFLAEMLDYVGLLSHGNEEMVAFAWKAFSQWQSRQNDETKEHREKRREMYRFMKGFRETFSRPVKRIRFLGLFDTVNSVPRFEAAWMQRSKFPYTARSSAKVIRHCVSIDERRAKFRQDLMYQGVGGSKRDDAPYTPQDKAEKASDEKYRVRRHAVSGNADGSGRGRRQTLAPPAEQAFRPRSRLFSRTPRASADGVSSGADARSELSQMVYDDESDDEEQDIDEIWFAGGHGDVGGGWDFIPGTKSASHVPLVYMIKEAEKAGLCFDQEKLVEMGVTGALEDSAGRESCDQESDADGAVPEIHIDMASPSPKSTPPLESDPKQDWGHFNAPLEGQNEKPKEKLRPFHEMLHQAHLARIHDSLEYSSGLGKGQVLSWKIMEYMPFRRMDLQSDGSWRPIRWPLPCGEVRDIPHTARVHGSVLRRMKEDGQYRPGNLIIGGGGRGMRVAPDEYGIGDWECVGGHGDPVEEVWVKKMPAPTEC